jgi:hypothetical protein
MGFGKKTDYPTGRVLDLDKSYEYIIKPAAEDAGYECKRADEVMHSGVIDVPMYQQLLVADVVVADVSTYNCNAFYELGVRHALKPFTTITIAEDNMIFPFDVNHLAIRKYRHLGEGIDFGEVRRMQKALREAISIVGAQATCDSPVYTFLKDLQPPVIGRAEAVSAGADRVAASFTMPAPAPPGNPTVSVLMKSIEEAFSKSDFVTAKSLLGVVRAGMPNDPYVIQKLALATYKSQFPTPIKALEDARAILGELKPEGSTDTETLGLCGAIHKRIWDLTGDVVHLDASIWAYEKGFYLKNDYYNGINLAYLLNVRAARTEAAPAEAIADFVLAQRTRRQVMPLCETDLQASPGNYWLLATLAEAYIGVGDDVTGDLYLSKARSIDPAPAQWMLDSTRQQVDRLKSLLSKSPLARIM